MNLLRPVIRGECPGVAAPMMTGDGLLARLGCTGPLPIRAFLALCRSSQLHGNGTLEVTQRGSLQFRGLTATSAPLFAQQVSSLGLGKAADSRVIGNPLSGLDALEEIDTRDLQARVRTTVDFGALGPKVSVAIDGGGKLHLDRVRADIRLIASGGRFHLALGGDARSALSVGWLRPADCIPIIERVIALIATRGRAARARDLTAPAEIDRLLSMLPLESGAPPQVRPPAEPVGTHTLKRAAPGPTRVARGFALAFGHSTADALQHLAHEAAALGADSIRPAPGRALLAIGLTRSDADRLASIAAAAGFIVDPDDPRRRIVACTGSPGCASASLSTRELASALARTAGSFLDGSVTIHLSGCAKGCAHAGTAALTFSGPDRVIVNGTAGDVPHGVCPAERIVAGLQRLAAEREQSACSSAELLSRLGPAGVLDRLQEEARLV